MKKLILLCCLLNPIDSVLATTSPTQSLDHALHSELSRLKTLSAELNLYLPKDAGPNPAIVEDSLSMREAAIKRGPVTEQLDKSTDRPLQQADFALESLSLDQLEDPVETRPSAQTSKSGSRYRSR